MSTPDFTYTCRLCIQCDFDKAKNSLKSLYDTPEAALGVMNIAALYTATIPQTILSASDGLPQVICKSCLNKLTEMHKFQIMCLESEKTLRYIVEVATSIKKELEHGEDNEQTDETISLSTEHLLGTNSETNDNENDFEYEINEIKAEPKVTYSCVDDAPDKSSNELDLESTIEIKQTTLNENVVVVEHENFDERQHVCPLCCAAFKRKFLLNKHMELHVEKQKNFEEQFKCKHCEARLAEKESNRLHVRLIYVCNYCEQNFETSLEINRHLQVHLGKEIYTCELCPRGFVLFSELQMHNDEHINESAESQERNRAARREKEEQRKLKFQTEEFHNGELIEIWLSNGRKRASLSEWIFQKINKNLSNNKKQAIEKQIDNFIIYIYKNLKKYNRNFSTFKEKRKKWLESKMIIHIAERDLILNDGECSSLTYNKDGSNLKRKMDVQNSAEQEQNNSSVVPEVDLSAKKSKNEVT